MDRSDSVYVVDYDNAKVLKLPPGADTPTELPFVGLDHPYDVAVDGAGTVYVTDSGHNRVVALTAGRPRRCTSHSPISAFPPV